MSSSTPPVPPTPPTPPGTPRVPAVPIPNPGAAAGAPPVPPGTVPAVPLPPGVDAEVPADEGPKHGGDALSSPFAAFVTGAGTSFLLHLALIILGLLFIKPVRDGLAGLVTVEEQVVIPSAELATETPGGIPNPGMNNRPDQAAAQAVDSSVTQSDNFAEAKSETLTQTLTASGSGDTAPAAIAVGGASTGSNLGGQTGGGLAKFGVPGGGGGIGPKGAVFGDGGNAFRIVFICDGTGTMAEKMPLLRRELLSTISKLKPKQEFNVIFFKEGAEKGLAFPNQTLMNATPQNRAKTEQFLKTLSVSGGTDPTPAIEMAFKLKPQLIYLLSDGAFDDLKTYEEVIKQVSDLNTNKTVRVNTILFQNQRDDVALLKKAADAMQTIAKNNGGTFNSVDLRKLYGGG